MRVRKTCISWEDSDHRANRALQWWGKGFLVSRDIWIAFSLGMLPPWSFSSSPRLLLWDLEEQRLYLRTCREPGMGPGWMARAMDHGQEEAASPRSLAEIWILRLQLCCTLVSEEGPGMHVLTSPSRRSLCMWSSKSTSLSLYSSLQIWTSFLPECPTLNAVTL